MPRTVQQLQRSLDIIVELLNELLLKQDTLINDTLQKLQENQCFIPSVTYAQEIIQKTINNVNHASTVEQLESLVDECELNQKTQHDDHTGVGASTIVDTIFIPYFVLLQATKQGVIDRKELQQVENLLFNGAHGTITTLTSDAMVEIDSDTLGLDD